MRTASRKPWRLGALLVAAGTLAVAGAVVVAVNPASAAQGSAPPWAGGDPNGVGGLEFFDSAGAQITTGSTTTAPFATYVAGLAATRAGDTKAIMFAYVPQAGQTPDTWAVDEQFAAGSNFPNAAAPDPVKNNAFPTYTGAAADKSLATITTDLPNTSTNAAYQNVIEIRVYSNKAFATMGLQYDYADIKIDPSTNTWTQVYSPGDPLTGGGGTPTDTGSGTPTDTGSGTPTDTGSGTPTDTGSGTPTDTGSGTPTDTGSGTPTDTGSGTPTDTGSGTPTDTGSGTPTDTGSGTPTDSTPPAGPSDSTTPAATLPVTAIGADGTAVTDGATLTSGQQVTLNVGGFTANASVDVVVHSTPMDLGMVQANSLGQVSYPFSVPTGLAAGTHTVTFTNAADPTQVASFDFVIASTDPGAADTSDTSGSSGLASTGAQVGFFGGIGVALLAAGAMMLLLIRRRSTAKHH